MAQDPGIGYKVNATVIGVKGFCSAGHQAGEDFQVSCYNTVVCVAFFTMPFFRICKRFNLEAHYPGGKVMFWKCNAPTRFGSCYDSVRTFRKHIILFFNKDDNNFL